jgi:hypothetical protein
VAHLSFSTDEPWCATYGVFTNFDALDSLERELGQNRTLRDPPFAFSLQSGGGPYISGTTVSSIVDDFPQSDFMSSINL